MLLEKQYYGSYSQAPPYVKIYMDLCSPHSLHQVILEPIRKSERTKKLTDYVLWTSLEKVLHSCDIEMGLSDN